MLKLVEVEAILEDLQREAFMGIGMGRQVGFLLVEKKTGVFQTEETNRSK